MEGEEEGQEGGEEAGVAEGLDGLFSAFVQPLPYGEGGWAGSEAYLCAFTWIILALGNSGTAWRKKAGLLETHRRAVIGLATLCG